MKIKITLLTVFLCSLINTLLATGTSAAPPSPAPPKMWNQLFEGDPQGIQDDWSENDFNKWSGTGKTLPYQKWIRGYSQCQKEMDRVWTLLRNYNQHFRTGDEKGSESIYQDLLKSIGDEAPTECLEPAKRAYLAGVVNLGPAYGGYVDTFYRNDLVLFTILLSNKDMISLLTPEVRNKMANGKKSLWTQQKNGDYLLSGIYRCSQSQIYVSSNLRPFNLAASLAHEIDHLYRDKNGYRYMKDWVDNRDVRSFVVSDEILASLYGALFQRNLFLIDEASGSTVDYTSQGDEFNLFQKNGPLSQLMNFTQLAPPVPFFEFHGLISQKREDPWVKKKLCEVDKIIRTGYFTSSAGSCNLSGIFPKSTWFSFESYIASLENIRRDPTQFDNYVKELKEFSDSFQKPSAICAAMVDAEDHGDLKDYIGGQLENDGGHTGNSGVKPCLRVKY